MNTLHLYLRMLSKFEKFSSFSIIDSNLIDLSDYTFIVNIYVLA